MLQGYASVYSSDSAEDSENERVAKGRLGKLGCKRFEAMLRAVTPQRERIARCMSYALQHADAADDVRPSPFPNAANADGSLQVTTILIQSLMIDMTPIPRKLARLYVVSDILHNSSGSMPNAWKFRQTFEKALPTVFDHFNVVYRSFPGRMKAEGFRKQIGAVLSIWQTMLVFPQSTVDDLAERLAATDEVPNEADNGADTDGMDLDGEEVPGEEVPAAAGFKAAFKPTDAPAPALLDPEQKISLSAHIRLR